MYLAYFLNNRYYCIDRQEVEAFKLFYGAPRYNLDIFASGNLALSRN